MQTFSYTAKDPKTGQKIKAEVQADSEQVASKLIRQEGYIPLDIKSTAGGLSATFSKLNQHVKTKDKVIFSRQLATLINAGLPLIQSLRTVSEQTESKPFKVVITQVISEVEGGTTLSLAISKHPKIFNEVYISLVAAGEASGTLDSALEKLANQQEKDAEIVAKVRGALVYPILVLLVMAGVVGFMVVVVLPQVEVIYKGIPGVSLPLITRVLLGFSHFVINFWWIFVAILIGGGVFTTRWAKTLGGKRVIDGLKMKIWPVGPLFMKMYMARFGRTGSTLVAAGVPMIQMLEITGKAINNIHISDTLKKAAEKVKGGKTLSESIRNDPNFLSLVPNMLSVGEQSGAIEQMLSKIADYYEKEVDNQIKNISNIIEPVLMVVLGVVAFSIVAAVLLPIYGLVSKDIIH